MFLLNILFCVLVLYFSGTVNAKKCTDCVSISSCQEALLNLVSLEYGERETLQRIKNALCGFNGFEAQVCCSHFAVDKDPIEKHPNLALLPENCGEINSNDIIGSKLYEFPWMAVLYSRITSGVKLTCIGTIINSRYILTSGHCVYGATTVAEVRIGEFDISTEYDCLQPTAHHLCKSNTQDITVEKIITHEKFNNTVQSKHDIALIRLNDPIDFKRINAAPICLPLSKTLRDMTLEDKTAIVAGLTVAASGQDSRKLYKVEVPVIMVGECLKYNKTTSKIICVSEKDVICKGSSGAPLMVERDHKGFNRYIQYGIDSYGPTNCDVSIPEVYTDVTKFVRWILDNIED